MNLIGTLIATLSGWIWGPPMLTLLVGTGLYLTILLKGLQFRVLLLAFRMIFHKDHGHHGLMNGMMAIPNLIGLLILARVVKEETDRYFKS
jgi:AGCS family alanine or glycine:cation symporter